MKKDIEWLKEEIGELPCVDTVFNSGGSSYIDSAVPVMVVYDLIDKLDDPEVLSQEWINDNAVVGQYQNGIGYVVPVYRLQNLLVPKQEEGLFQVRLSEIIESDSYVNLDTSDGTYFLGGKDDVYPYQTKFTQDEVDGLPWELNDDWDVIPVEVAE